MPGTPGGPVSDPQRPLSGHSGGNPPRLVRCQYSQKPHPLDDECVNVTDAYGDDLEASLCRVLTAVDGLPPKVEARPADRDDFDCSPYPEGDGRHDYRKTASSHDRTGLDHTDYRDGETCWRCRRCGDVFVALDSEMAASEERWSDGD